jgi:hypothetical protein
MSCSLSLSLSLSLSNGYLLIFQPRFKSFEATRTDFSLIARSTTASWPSNRLRIRKTKFAPTLSVVFLTLPRLTRFKLEQARQESTQLKAAFEQSGEAFSKLHAEKQQLQSQGQHLRLELSLLSDRLSALQHIRQEEAHAWQLARKEMEQRSRAESSRVRWSSRLCRDFRLCWGYVDSKGFMEVQKFQGVLQSLQAQVARLNRAIVAQVLFLQNAVGAD